LLGGLTDLVIPESAAGGLVRYDDISTGATNRGTSLESRIWAGREKGKFGAPLLWASV
jgi:hypothetical protein